MSIIQPSEFPMNRASLFLVLFVLSFAFAQEGAIKFQIPLDSTGMPTAPPPKQEPQKLGVAAGRPLNLADLSAKDTASFDTYSKRRALVQDSISATQREVENAKKRSQSQMPTLEPKGEFEKQAEYDVRKAKWEKELGELTQRNIKPLMDRFAELERARKKIEENQVSLYCTVDIKTSPSAASVYLNKEEIGASPAEYSLALPGYTVIRIQKENYEPWDTTLTLQPAQKLKINVVLQEKSIFSKEGELNFPKILAKDTIVKGYRERIARVEARMKQIDGEIKAILEDFGNKYPALEPQKPGETAQDFGRRQTAWRNEGIKQVEVLRQKHEAYKNKLVRSIEVLEDNIIATQSQLVAETPTSVQITLGAYDVEREAFEITVQDTANARTPFRFVGMVGIPRDTAKTMNRNASGFIADGFTAGVSYLNYPFIHSDSVSGDSSFNLAMKELSLSRKAAPLKAEGGFKPISRFEAMEGYGAWRVHADSLLGGTLKPQGLDLNYALKGEKTKEAVAAASSKEGGGGGLGWRDWTRIFTFSAAAACGALAIMKHSKAEDETKKYNEMNKTPPDRTDSKYPDWFKRLSDKKKIIDDSNSDKYIFGAAAGVFVVAGTLTFVF
jgi:uncharacterized protein YukE